MFQRSSGPKKTAHQERAYKKATASPVVFETEASQTGSVFQDSFVCLYGMPKIGKSTLASHLPGAYFLATERGLKFLTVRSTFISSWEDFKAFVLWAEGHKAVIASVKMWIIDTVTILAKHCMYGVCADLGISHPSDEGYGKGWEAFADEFTGWILRLCALGKGVMFICHESCQEVTFRSMKINHYGPDIPRTAYRTIMPLCDVILHLAHASGKDGTGKQRCLYTQPSEIRDAGDRSHHLPEEIHFTTEKIAVRKILSAYEGDNK